MEAEMCIGGRGSGCGCRPLFFDSTMVANSQILGLHVKHRVAVVSVTEVGHLIEKPSGVATAGELNVVEDRFLGIVSPT